MPRSVTPCSFDVLFDEPNKCGSTHEESSYRDEILADDYTYLSSSSSPVDCTLSLGTASTRQSNGRTSIPAFRSDIFSQAKNYSPSTNRAGSGSISDGGDDALLARRCANCDTTSTPLWRNGPRGPKSLCNACGIRYKKEERRAAARMVPAEAQMARHGYEGHPWGCYVASMQRSSSTSSGSEFRSLQGCEGNRDAAALPYLSWSLNVPQRRAEYLHHY